MMGVFLLTAGTMSTLLYASSSSEHVEDVVSKLAEKPILLNKPGITKNDIVKVQEENVLLNKLPEDEVKKKPVDKVSLDTNVQDNAPINKDEILKAGRVLNSQKEDTFDQKVKDKQSNYSKEYINKQNKVISKDNNETTRQPTQHVVQSHSTGIPQQVVDIQSNGQYVPNSLHVDKSLYNLKQPVGEPQQQQQQQQQPIGDPQQQQPIREPQQQQQQPVRDPQQQQQQRQQPIGDPQQQQQQPIGDPQQQQQQQPVRDPQQQQQPVGEPKIQADNGQQSFQNNYPQYNVLPHNR